MGRSLLLVHIANTPSRQRQGKSLYETADSCVDGYHWRLHHWHPLTVNHQAKVHHPGTHPYQDVPTEPREEHEDS